MQVKLGSDIQMVLDVCPPLPSPPGWCARPWTAPPLWAERARKAFLAYERPDLSQFGIVQGGIDHALRAESARAHGGGRLRRLRRGRAVGGGGPVGRDAARARGGRWPGCPAGRPRYLMGLGDPLGMVDAVARGVDMFDCVLPTRLARHGTHAHRRPAGSTSATAASPRDAGPLDPTCGCPVCARWSRAYLRHLLSVAEPTAPRLLTIHNVAWTSPWSRASGRPIADGSLAALRAELAGRWPAERRSAVRPMAGPATRSANLVRPPMEPLIVLAVTFVLLWVLFILPQQRRVRAHQAAGRLARAG